MEWQALLQSNQKKCWQSLAPVRLTCALELTAAQLSRFLTEQSFTALESGLLWLFPDQRESLLTPSTLRDRARQPLGQNINTKAQGTRERVHYYTVRAGAWWAGLWIFTWALRQASALRAGLVSGRMCLARMALGSVSSTKTKHKGQRGLESQRSSWQKWRRWCGCKVTTALGDTLFLLLLLSYLALRSPGDGSVQSHLGKLRHPLILLWRDALLVWSSLLGDFPNPCCVRIDW